MKRIYTIDFKITFFFLFLLHGILQGGPSVIILDIGGTLPDWIFSGGDTCPDLQKTFKASSNLLHIETKSKETVAALKILLGEKNNNLFSGQCENCWFVAPSSFKSLAGDAHFVSPDLSGSEWAALRKKFGVPVHVSDKQMEVIKIVRKQFGSSLGELDENSVNSLCFGKQQPVSDSALLKETFNLLERKEPGLIITVLQEAAIKKVNLGKARLIFNRNEPLIGAIFDKIAGPGMPDDSIFIYLSLFKKPDMEGSGFSLAGCGIFWGGPFRRGIVCTDKIPLIQVSGAIRYVLGRGSKPGKESLFLKLFNSGKSSQ